MPPKNSLNPNWPTKASNSRYNSIQPPRQKLKEKRRNDSELSPPRNRKKRTPLRHAIKRVSSLLVKWSSLDRHCLFRDKQLSNHPTLPTRYRLRVHDIQARQNLASSVHSVGCAGLAEGVYLGRTIAGVERWRVLRNANLWLSVAHSDTPWQLLLYFWKYRENKENYSIIVIILYSNG